MHTRDLAPRTMNFMATAEAVFPERVILSRIDKLLTNPFKECLGGDQVKRLQVTFLHHMDLLAKAENEWKLGPDLLDDCLAHLRLVGFRYSYSEDLEHVRQAEKTLSLIGEIDEYLRPLAALGDEANANKHHLNEGDCKPD